MKHSTATNDLQSRLSASLQGVGPDTAPAALPHLVDLIEWLHPAACRLGLTQYSDPTALADGLIIPAFAVLRPELPPSILSPALDFGAGSGAVGLSLAIILPGLQVVLADRRKRVVEFLDLVLTRFSVPNCTTLQVDLAEPPAEQANSFGLVLIRAYGPASEALTQAARWLKPAGAAALWHQPPSPDPPEGLVRAETVPTLLSALALTIYSRS